MRRALKTGLYVEGEINILGLGAQILLLYIGILLFYVFQLAVVAMCHLYLPLSISQLGLASLNFIIVSIRHLSSATHRSSRL
jgi:hypothetical protein